MKKINTNRKTGKKYWVDYEIAQVKINDKEVTLILSVNNQYEDLNKIKIFDGEKRSNVFASENTLKKIKSELLVLSKEELLDEFYCATNSESEKELNKVIKLIEELNY